MVLGPGGLPGDEAGGVSKRGKDEWTPRLSHDWVRVGDMRLECSACKATKEVRVDGSGAMRSAPAPGLSVCQVRSERAQRSFRHR